MNRNDSLFIDLKCRNCLKHVVLWKGTKIKEFEEWLKTQKCPEIADGSICEYRGEIFFD